MNMHTMGPLQGKSLETLQATSIQFQQISHEVRKVIIGNEDAINQMIVALVCNGHVLLEGVPGVAKTTMIKTLAQVVALDFKRIQFTPDLLPSDLIGTLIFNQKTFEFETRKGPIFANFILADEINRAPAKVQAALLESMQERQVTLGNSTFKLEEPFLVFATQNPIEQEGTYRLPEAQVDRFLFKIIITYPSITQEKQIIYRTHTQASIMPLVTGAVINQAQQLINSIYVDEKVVDYIIAIIFATRNPKQSIPNIAEYIACGASPRATLALYQAARAYAFLQGRSFTTPDDVKKMAYPVLRHRISTTYQADAQRIDAEQIIKTILTTLPTP